MQVVKKYKLELEKLKNVGFEEKEDLNRQVTKLIKTLQNLSIKTNLEETQKTLHSIDNTFRKIKDGK